MNFHKYNVSPKAQRTCDGIVFDSKKEMAYYQELKLRKVAKDIKGFEMQVPFVFTLNGKKMFKHIADFIIYYKDGNTEVVDVKGFLTSIYRLKKRIIEEEFKIKINEI